ncbi:hypothetical protein CIPAW_15G016100 [Carya illinoinensis]|uniref:Uncharacterized protein n=1 Tax=Carya illinoinensis TaxID=32201 RepID=A0A8T1NB13_CARIL|nr:hypothetical protein CIPAW_15G016100 [Carya illinoinensis]
MANAEHSPCQSRVHCINWLKDNNLLIVYTKHIMFIQPMKNIVENWGANMQYSTTRMYKSVYPMTGKLHHFIIIPPTILQKDIILESMEMGTMSCPKFQNVSIPGTNLLPPSS